MALLPVKGLKMVTVQGDGNCCFTAVANALSMNESAMERAKAFLSGIDISTSNCTSLAMVLRHLAVKEWKENIDYYEGFI
jgi:post-segregation antitoxin (ccd killing protein)